MTDFKTEWKALAAQGNITATSITSYCLIRAINAKSNDKLQVALGLLYKTFTPITNVTKIRNGAQPYQAIDRELASLRWAVIKRPASVWGYLSLTEAQQALYQELLLTLQNYKFENKTYAYICVRHDISPEQQLVQTAHATMVLGQNVPANQHDASHLNFVVFSATDGNDLNEKFAKLNKRKGVELVSFTESALNNQMTAFACKPMRKSWAIRKMYFDEYQLLTMSK